MMYTLRCDLKIPDEDWDKTSRHPLLVLLGVKPTIYYMIIVFSRNPFDVSLCLSIG